MLHNILNPHLCHLFSIKPCIFIRQHFFRMYLLMSFKNTVVCVYKDTLYKENMALKVKDKISAVLIDKGFIFWKQWKSIEHWAMLDVNKYSAQCFNVFLYAYCKRYTVSYSWPGCFSLSNCMGTNRRRSSGE
jgi:hypothetical protein